MSREHTQTIPHTTIPSKSKVTAVNKKHTNNNSILSKGRLQEESKGDHMESTKNKNKRNLTSSEVNDMTTLSGKGGYRNNIEMLSSGEEA